MTLAPGRSRRTSPRRDAAPAIRGLMVVVVLASAVACMPASWGAGALLHPSRRPLTTPRPADAEEVVVRSGDLRLFGWRLSAAGPRRGTLVYLHGSADNRASGLSIAERFRRRGFDAVLFDSRAHGESEGDACTYGYHEKRDLARIVDTLGKGPVVAFGVSLGGAVALQAAAEDRRISAVVAVAPFSDIRTVARERAPSVASQANIDAAFRLAEQQAHFVADDVSPARAAGQIRVPVLLVHGEDDHETPPAHSQRIFEGLTSDKRLVLVPGAGHLDALTPGVWQIIEDWIDRVLPMATKASDERRPIS